MLCCLNASKKEKSGAKDQCRGRYLLKVGWPPAQDLLLAHSYQVEPPLLHKIAVGWPCTAQVVEVQALDDRAARAEQQSGAEQGTSRRSPGESGTEAPGASVPVSPLWEPACEL